MRVSHISHLVRPLEVKILAVCIVCGLMLVILLVKGEHTSEFM